MEKNKDALSFDSNKSQIKYTRCLGDFKLKLYYHEYAQFKLVNFFYSKSNDYVPLPLPSRYRFGPYVNDRYRFRANVTQCYINVTDRYWPLPNFTVTSVTDRNIVCFEQIFKV